VKIFVNGLKPEIFKEEIYSRSYEYIQAVIIEAREELSTYRELFDIQERMKKSDVRKEPGRSFESPRPKSGKSSPGGDSSPFC
jgi:hypothetical protein